MWSMSFTVSRPQERKKADSRERNRLTRHADMLYYTSNTRLDDRPEA